METMTMTGEQDGRRRTTAVMRDTVDQLKEAAAILRRSAEATPSADAKTRLHHLADQVIDTANDIAQRTDTLSGHEDVSTRRHRGPASN
ncbi:hypothetical protein [Actinoplanes philippinensis]|uniref:hypothetical protein n=1 Tax=Actinoplanes philippinensis TaxID=35752 RepID=UPI0033E2C90B